MRALPVHVRADFDLAATDLVRVLTVVPFEAAVADLFDLMDLAAECSVFLSIFLMPCLDRIFDDAWPLVRFAVETDSIDAWASPRRPDRCVIADLATILVALVVQEEKNVSLSAVTCTMLLVGFHPHPV